MILETKHIEWIDGAKGVAILSVILLHSLPCLREIGWIWHIGQAVPVFLFITAYLISIRFESFQSYFTWDRFARMIKRVFVPFVIVLTIQLVCYALIDKLPSLKTIIKDGGIGSGSYYIWLYMQSWVLMPFMAWLVRKTPIWLSCIMLLMISILAEYVFVPLQGIENIDKLYRLLPTRYFMVLYLGCVWPILKDKQKFIFYGLACVSALLILNNVYFVDNAWLTNTFMGGVKSCLRIGMATIGILLSMYLYLWQYWRKYTIQKSGSKPENIVGIYSYCK